MKKDTIVLLLVFANSICCGYTVSDAQSKILSLFNSARSSETDLASEVHGLTERFSEDLFIIAKSKMTLIQIPSVI